MRVRCQQHHWKDPKQVSLIAKWILRPRLPPGSPEWTIKRAGELRRITHKCTLIPIPPINKSTLDRLDSAIHHVTRGDAVCTGLRIVQGNLCDSGRRGLSIYGHVLAEDTTVPVRGILAKADVCGDVQRGEEFAQLLNREDDGALRVVCRCTALILNCTFHGK